MENSEITNWPAERTVTKRAAAACLRCRSRKVRCDLLQQQGATCTNCRLDKQECVVKANRRHRKASSFSGTKLDIVSHNSLISSDGQNHGSQMIHQMHHEPASPWNDINGADIAKPPVLKDVVDQAHCISNSAKLGSAAPELLNHFKPPPATMKTDEVEYLKLKGAFSVPPADLLHQLLQSYIDFVHPHNPILEIEDIFAMERPSENGQLSYLLFQAVNLGGSLFVDMKHLAAAGYPTRKSARQAFYSKARVLYEHDYEEDRLLIAQSLLLMSLWFEAPDSHKDCWYWSGLAIALVQSTYLNQSHSMDEIERKELRQWRKMWWTGFVRDRLIGLGMKLPIRLIIDDYRVRTLVEDDLNCHEPARASEAASFSWSSERERQITVNFIEEVKLCLYIDHFLRVLRTEKRHYESMLRELQMCEKELRDWLLNLPQEAILSFNSTSQVDPALTTHQAVLRMLHLCAFTFLQRSCQTLSSFPTSQPPSPKVLDAQNTARLKICSAAGMMAEVAQYLRRTDLVQYLPHSAVISFIHVNIIYLIDLTSINSISGISASMRAMEVFRESYFETDYGTRLVNSAFQRESLQSPVIDTEPELEKGESVPSSPFAADPCIRPTDGFSLLPLQGVSVSSGDSIFNDSAFDLTASHDRIVQELSTFISSAEPTWDDTWQREINDYALASKLQTTAFPLDVGMQDQEADFYESLCQEAVSVRSAVDQKAGIAFNFTEDYGTRPSIDWPTNNWLANSTPKNADLDGAMHSDEMICYVTIESPLPAFFIIQYGLLAC